jgi:hypothetical protein
MKPKGRKDELMRVHKRVANLLREMAKADDRPIISFLDRLVDTEYERFVMAQEKSTVHPNPFEEEA